MEITVDDVIQISEIMGKDFSDVERTNVIQYLESCDVNACPGSGKTTTMVAKLLIMSTKLSGTLTGICALSHTNAAKNEIEKSYGIHSDALLRFPNFVGTIQVFIDMFLAIPAYIEEFGHRPLAIDDDLYENVAKRNYTRIPHAIIQGFEHRPNINGQDFVSDISYKFENFDLVNFNGNREIPLYFSNTTPTYRELLRWKQRLTSLGYLTYHDAFSYANRYLKKYPNLALIIAKRFPYVFIDEMQDTDEYQQSILESIFRGRSIVQRFGDPNQTIYNQRSQGGTPVWQPNNNFPIGSSRRLSPSISRLCQGISSHPHEIIGNVEIPDHSHTIILFDALRKENVIQRFGEIIEREGIINDGPFKVLGAVGKPNVNPNYLSISSYWPNFQRRFQSSLNNNPFWGYVGQARSTIMVKMNYAEAYQKISNAFVELLHYQRTLTPEGLPYSSTRLIRSIKDSGTSNFLAYKGIILRICEILQNNFELSVDEVVAQARTLFSFLNIQLEGHAEEIVRNHNQEIPQLEQIEGNPNIFRFSPMIDIEIDTIHSAKGQTHKCTMLLETFYKQNDLSTIHNYLMGQSDKNPGVMKVARFLPLTYVACSRPTHLLCLAIQTDHLTDQQIYGFQQFGWQLDYLN